MKYIRTKDKIFTNKNPNGDKKVYTARYREEDIIAEADTIEELCDRYLFESNSKESHYQYDMLMNLNHKFKMHLLEYGCVYGAIWISGENDEPILKLVAKMNADGDLELI